MRIIFMGTPEFAVPSLEAVLREHEVIAVVTQPDKPKGRGKKLGFSPIKEVALKKGLIVHQPRRVRDPEFVETLKGYAPDVIVVVAFGQILPESVLEIPRFGCINVHGSLLPQYRGAAPIQWSVINGDAKTGVTTMYMAKGLDSGDMLLKEEIYLSPDETYGSLHDTMAPIGAELLLKTLQLMAENKLVAIPQNHDMATLAPMIKSELEHIDWSGRRKDIKNLINGLNPAPGAYTILNGEKLKIRGVAYYTSECIGIGGSVGEVLEITKEGFTVRTGDGVLLITMVQGSGGKVMSADAYVRGHKINVGSVLV